ncbi:MAG: hypothetical protein ABIK44_02100 [candidate division WOR-3 bacterium]
MYPTKVSAGLAFLVTLALGTVPLLAPPDEPQNSPWLNPPVSNVTDEETAIRGEATTVVATEPDYARISGSPGQEIIEDDQARRVWPDVDWGNDVLIGSMGTTPTWGTLSTDNDVTNGDIWVGVLDPNAGYDDTVWVWRSTDGGNNWTKLYGILGIPSRGGIIGYQLVVGGDANGTWIYDFVLYDGVGAPSGGGGLWVLRHRPPLGNAHWTQISNDSSIVKFSADRNIESPQHLFVGWQERDGDIKLISSSDSAQTWGNLRWVDAGCWNCAVCAGGDGYVYIAYIPSDSTFYWIGRYTNNLISPSMVFVSCDSSPDNRFRQLSIAAARTAPGSSQTAIAFATYKYVPNGNIGPRYSWTTNGGQTWSYSFWPVTNQPRATWDARHPRIRRSYGGNPLFRAVVTMDEPTTSWDTLVYAYATASNPTSWAGRATPNDFRITGEFGAGVDYCDIIGGGGGYVAYRHYAEREIYFDGWNWTGLEEKGLSQRGPRASAFFNSGVRLHLTGTTRVSAALYDNTGRLVRTVFEGLLGAGDHNLPVTGVAPGVYFVRLNLDGIGSTTKLIRL